VAVSNPVGEVPLLDNDDKTDEASSISVRIEEVIEALACSALRSEPRVIKDLTGCSELGII
jgi:hypothetical protein